MKITAERQTDVEQAREKRRYRERYLIMALTIDKDRMPNIELLNLGFLSFFVFQGNFIIAVPGVRLIRGHFY